MTDLPVLKGERVLLRKPLPKDIDDRLTIGKPDEYVKMTGGDTRNIGVYTRVKATSWYENVCKHPCAWMIEYEGRCIGVAKLNISIEDNKAGYTVGIFDFKVINMGLGTEVTKLILEYAFDVLELHRVELKVLEYNTRAIKCYENCGFITEGIEREGAYIEDFYHSYVIMGMLKHEYEKLYNTNLQ